ncbi:MAG: T9SS type A sorting domain-containing protein [Cyclobacteriaceae bacterium]
MKTFYLFSIMLLPIALNAQHRDAHNRALENETQSIQPVLFKTNLVKDSTLSYDWNTTTQDWVYTDKSLIKYNNDTLENCTIRYQWSDFTETWDIQAVKIETTYTPDGQKSEVLGKSWNTQNNTFQNSYKETYTYNSEGKATKYEAAEWSEADLGWRTTTIEMMEYDESNRLVLFELYQWDENSDRWTGLLRFTNTTFDESDRVAESFDYKWESTYWASSPYYKYEHEYNEEGSRTRYSGYELDETTNLWVERHRDENTYTESNQLDVSLRYSLNRETDSLELIGKSEFTYSSYGSYTSLGYTYDRSTEEWLLSGKFSSLFDENGNQILSESYYCSSPDNCRGSIKFEHVYAPDGHKTETTTFVWDESTNDWTKVRLFEAFYSEYQKQEEVSELSNTPFNQLQIFPNPASSFVKLNMPAARLSLYTPEGRLVLDDIVSQGDRSNISHLPKGLYIYHITTKTESSTGKLIVN